MSSFIIEKAEYAKVAGIIASIKHRGSYSVLNEIYTDMMKVYENNVKSVNKQYNTRARVDKTDYTELFFAFSQKEFNDKDAMRANVFKFFRSALYQIEDDKLYNESAAIFFDLLRCMMPDTEGWWGSVPESLNL